MDELRIIKQLSCLQQLKTIPINSKDFSHIKNQNNSQCLFSILPCSSKSKYLKATIDEQKSSNEQFIELSTIKHFIDKVKIQNSTKIQQKQRRKQCKDHQKGIFLTARKGDQKKFCQFQTTKQYQNHNSSLNNNSNVNGSFHSHNDSKYFESQDKGYHRLNPLNIAKTSYDGQVKLGGKKQIQKTRHSLCSFEKIEEMCQKVHIKSNVTDQRVSFSSNNNVKFHLNNYEMVSSSISNSGNKIRFIPINFKYETNFKSQKQSLQGQQCNFSSQVLTQKSTKQNVIEKKFNFTQRKQSGEKFKDICLQNNQTPQKNVLFTSNFSNHSQKYRNYIVVEQLLQPFTQQKEKTYQGFNVLNNFQPLDEGQITYLQHNQKSQILQEPQQGQNVLQKLLESTDNKSRSHLVYSSLTVTEGRQKQIYSARNIYNEDNLLGDSIESSKELKQPNSNNTFKQSCQGQNQKQFLAQFYNEEEKLRKQIRILYDQLTYLKKQQKHLQQHSFQLRNCALSKLDKQMRQIQNLNQLSIQRSLDIETLKQLIRVKKIQRYFMLSQNKYDTYLKDQNAWNKYMNFNNNFSLVYFNHQTSETQYQQGLSIEN